MNFLNTLSNVATGASNFGTILGIGKGVAGLLGLGGDSPEKTSQVPEATHGLSESD